MVDSVLRLYPDVLRRHVDAGVAGVEPVLIAPIVDITDGGHAVLDEAHLGKQPDWTFDDTDSGKAPVQRLAAG